MSFSATFSKLRDGIFEAVGKPFSAALRLFKDRSESPLSERETGKGIFELLLKILFFFAVFYAIYATMEAHRPPQFTGDAHGYWNSAKVFVNTDKVFSFTHYVSYARGYLASFSVFLFVRFATDFLGFVDPVSAYYFSYALFSAVILTFVAPYVFCKAFKKRFSFLSLGVFISLLLIFFGGDFAHPLTDIPALCFIFISLAAYFKLDDGRFRLLSAFLVGLSAAAAYNLRQIYLIFLFAMIAMTALKIFATREVHSFFGITRGVFKKILDKINGLKPVFRVMLNGARKALKISLLIVGAVIVMIPQVIINRAHLNKSDWQVQTQTYPLAAEGVEYPLVLFNAHGLATMLKVDFWVRDFNTHEIYAAVYPNSPFEGYEKCFDYESYFNSIKSNPKWYIESWLNSAFLGMVATYGESYITDLTTGFFERAALSIFMISCFVVTVFSAVFKFFKTKGKRERARHNFFTLIPVLAIVLSGAVSCLTKMESRYLLPWFAIVYGVFAFYSLADLRLNIPSLRSHAIKALKCLLPVAVIFILFLLWYIPLLKDNSLIMGELTRVYGDFLK